MPFVPLSPDEQREYAPCRDPQHNPPTHIVLNEPAKWQCPSCGREVVISPTKVYC